MKNKAFASALLVLLTSCASGSATPGMTLLTGITGYRDEMARLETSADRWPDRQRVAESLKKTYLLTMGGSQDFNRLVELDLKRREFLLTLREPRLRSERAREIKQELPVIDREIDSLLTSVKGQVHRLESRTQEKPQVIENVATIGLLDLSLNSFSGTGAPRDSPVARATVGLYVVTDSGSLTSVDTPEGETYRCMTMLIQEQGAGIRCEAVALK